MAMRAPESFWIVDPDDPRAPPDHIWDAMTPEERKRVVDSLPSEFPASESMPPEGDPHFKAKTGTRQTLEGHITRSNRRIYIASELPVYYPGEKMFAPDVMAVLDVELKERMSWIVRDEGKGLDFALEIVVAGDRKKDLEVNVERYARLGIFEYFVFDRGRLQLRGYRLAPSGPRVYRPILAQAGLYSSTVLGLELCIEETRLRFYHAGAPLPDAAEQIVNLQRMVDDIHQRLVEAEERAAAAEEQAAAAAKQAAEAEKHAAEAEERAIEEARLRAEAEHKLSEARATIVRLEAKRAARSRKIK